MIAALLLLQLDLAVHELPQTPEAPGVTMRAEPKPGRKPSAQPTPAPAPTEVPEVHYRLNVGYGAEAARATTAPAATGFSDPSRTLFRSYLFGDTAFGARGVPVASLDTYFAANYYYDFLGNTADSPFTTVYDRADANARALLIRSAYAEYDPAARGVAPLFIRAGRQFRLGAGIANFDGVSAGFDDSRVEASGFVGRRVALWADERTGVVEGATLRAHLSPLLPADAAVDVLGFEGDVYTDASVRVAGARGSMQASARLFGASLSDLLLRGRMPLGRHVGALADVTQKLGSAPIYDFVAGGELTSNGLRYFTLPEELAFTRMRLGAQLDPLSAVEILAWTAATIVEGSHPPTDPGPTRSGFDASWLELGSSVDWRPGLGLTLLAGYRLRVYDRPSRPFRLDDPASAGERHTQELSADGRYSLGPRRLTTTASAFVRYDEIRTPLSNTPGELRGGLRFDVESWLVSRIRFKATYEIADPSPVFSPDVDTLQSVRVIAEAAF